MNPNRLSSDRQMPAPEGARGPAWPVLAVAVLCGAAALALWPLWGVEGWPANHDRLGFVWRVRIWAEHWAMGDLYPVWSSQDTLGLGSPMPAFYHKLFNAVGAAFLVLGANMKAALMLTIATFLVVGGGGVVAGARALGVARVGALALGVAFVFSNYATTNWLVRGAMAEFSANALVPYALWWLVTVWRTGRWPVWIGPVMLALVLAHSVIAYATAWLLGAGVAGAWLRMLANTGWAGARASAARAVGPAMASVALFAVPALLAALPATALMGEAGVGAITEGGYRPAEQFRPIVAYFSDGAFRWGVDWQAPKLSLRLDVGLLALCIAALVVVPWRARQAGRAVPASYGVAMGLVVLALGLMALQTPLMAWVYAVAPGWAYLQFPWRWLGALAGVLALASAAGLAAMEALSARRLATVLAVGAAGLAVVTHGGFSALNVPVHGPDELASRTKNGLVLSGMGEYFPPIQGMDVGATYDYVRALAAHPQQGNTCTVRDETPGPGERLQRRFRIHCPQTATVRLPVMYSPAMTVMVDGGPVVFKRRPDDPRVAVFLAAGAHTATVTLPGYKAAVSVLWKKINRD